jgi:hypothetical protein
MIFNDKKESIVGKKLSELTTKRVIILVLAMLFSQPIFFIVQYINQPDDSNYGIFLAN